MRTIDFVLAIISVISFGLAIYSFINTELKKAKEKANVEIMKERLKSLYQGLGAIFHSADAIVQVPKNRNEVKVEELQDIARVLRAQVYFLLEKTHKSSTQLEEWKFGEVIKSEPLEMILKEHKNFKKTM